MTDSFEKDPNFRAGYNMYYEVVARAFGSNAAILYGKIIGLARETGFAYMAIPNMADEVGIDRGTAEKYIKVLVKEKLILDVTKQYWDRYQEILKEKKFKKSSRYSKPIRLYCPNVERYDELVLNSKPDVKTTSYEDVFDEDGNSRTGKFRNKTVKNHNNDAKNHSNDGKNHNNDEKFQDNDAKFQQIDAKNPNNDVEIPHEHINITDKSTIEINIKNNTEGNREINKESEYTAQAPEHLLDSDSLVPDEQQEYIYLDNELLGDEDEHEDPWEKKEESAEELHKKIDNLLAQMTDEQKKKSAKIATNRNMELNYKKISDVRKLNAIVVLLQSV